ncbi:SidA/IucD/PvdA family monooxygenase [Streptomyces sp. NPDC059070]|uniref:SidA/IucD/PvdA family monooxygenase n=1 Tax=Streptomyces sp. NPDC059070 TaxID=3346713 RepID=UPI003681E9B1
MYPYDVIVVGAGPYGRSIAARAGAAGLDLRLFGRPPRPGPRGSVPPVPPLDDRTVTAVRPYGPRGFEVVTEDGESVRARTVALAVGARPFAHVPDPVRHLAPHLLTHSSERYAPAGACGDVTVIGGGRAALETALRLAERATRVRLIVRAPALAWAAPPPPGARPLPQRLRSPRGVLGDGWRNWFCARHPALFRRLPAGLRSRTAPGAAGAWWLREAVEGAGLDVLVRHEVTHAAATARGRVRLTLTGPLGAATSLETDHVVAATGYRPATARITLLSMPVHRRLGPAPEAPPWLSPRFESPHPGLFLTGPVAAPAFGPALRCVQGVGFAAERVVEGVERRVGRTRPGTG